MGSRRHIPQRMCVACHKVTAQRELIRLVRVAAGHVEVDPSGRKAGRGGYLCPAAACWEIGLKRGLLGRALRMSITLEEQEQLLRYRKDHLAE